MADYGIEGLVDSDLKALLFECFCEASGYVEFVDWEHHARVWAEPEQRQFFVGPWKDA